MNGRNNTPFIIVLYKIHQRSRAKHNQLQCNKIHKLLQNVGAMILRHYVDFSQWQDIMWQDFFTFASLDYPNQL